MQPLTLTAAWYVHVLVCREREGLWKHIVQYRFNSTLYCNHVNDLYNIDLIVHCTVTVWMTSFFWHCCLAVHISFSPPDTQVGSLSKQEQAGVFRLFRWDQRHSTGCLLLLLCISILYWPAVHSQVDWFSRTLQAAVAAVYMWMIQNCLVNLWNVQCFFGWLLQSLFVVGGGGFLFLFYFINLVVVVTGGNCFLFAALEKLLPVESIICACWWRNKMNVSRMAECHKYCFFCFQECIRYGYKLNSLWLNGMPCCIYT